jgi:cell division GTPase FtsZ
MNNPMEESLDLIGPKIAVVGLGGAGGNAVDNMIRMGLKGVHYLVCNTDAQALSQSLCPESNRIRLGFNITKGLGAGSSPETGRRAAEESVAECCLLQPVWAEARERGRVRSLAKLRVKLAF